MIGENELMPLNFYKKAVFTGGYQGMRYRLEKVEEEEKKEFLATIWPEPYNFETTKEEKCSTKFPFSEQGKKQMVSWLNRQYEEQKERWTEAKNRFW